MLSLLTSIIGIIVTIVLVVGIHEFGHFIVARLCGVKVHCFSIGFGKTLFQWRDKKGTEYIIAAIPLGGYVKMLDENEEDVSPKQLPFAFNRQPIYKKAAIIAAGPLFNFLFAILLYWLLFVIGFSTVKPIIGNIAPHSIAAKAGLKPQEEILKIDGQLTPSWIKAMIHMILRAGDHGIMQIETQPFSVHSTKTKAPYPEKTKNYLLDLSKWKMDDLKPDPFASLGITPYQVEIAPVIGAIQADSPALHAHLQVNDKILSIDKKPIQAWTDILAIMSTVTPGNILSFEVLREGKRMIIPVTIGVKRKGFFKKQSFLGISPHIISRPELIKYNQYTPGIALIYALQETKDFIHLNIITVGKLLVGKISLHSLGGPITIFENAGTALNQGIVPFLSFLAFLSISIGFINIIPIPGLDGGHLLFQLIEFVIRRPLSQRTQELCYRLGFILLLVLIIQALANDVMRL